MGICVIYRCVNDIVISAATSSETLIEKESGVGWAIFIFVSVLIGDILPTFLLIPAFTHESSEDLRTASMALGMSEPLIVQYSLQYTSNIRDSMLAEGSVIRETICDGMFGDNILKSGEEEIMASQIDSTNIIGLFFGGQWCSSCREFEKKLLEVYNKVNEESKRLEIIFFSCDYDENAFKEHFARMPWLAIPYEDPIREHYTEKLAIAIIPQLIIINKKGEQISRGGKRDIEKHGVKAFDKWVKQAI